VASGADVTSDLQCLLDTIDDLTSIRNMPRRVALCRQALRRVHRTDTASWVHLKRELGNSLAQSREGDQVANLEAALRHFREAAPVVDRRTDPENWALLQNSIGALFLDRLKGQRARNVEKAITRLKAVLFYYNGKRGAPEYAMIHYNLGRAYALRTHGSASSNERRALHHLRNAGRAYEARGEAADLASVENMLGQVYSNRQQGRHATNMERAIEYYQRALGGYTRRESPEDWATAQSNLGSAYQERVAGDKSENLETSLGHLRAALVVYKFATHPVDWAAVQVNLANTYLERIIGDEERNLEASIYHFRSSLRVYRRERFPMEWAQIQNGLGEAYRLYYYRAWSGHLERAIEHYTQALSIFKRPEFRQSWALTQRNLCSAYRSRIRGRPSDNLEQAIAHGQRALKVFSATGSGSALGSTFVALASAFAECSTTVRSEAPAQAAQYFAQALSIYRRAGLHVELRQALVRLGDLHFRENDWRTALVAYRQSGIAERVLLKRAKTDTARRAIVTAVSRPHARAAYCWLKLGRHDKALLEQEEGRTRLLAEAPTHLRVNPSVIPAASPLAESSTRRGKRLADVTGQKNRELQRILALAPSNGALVIPLVTPKGGAVFVLPSGAASVRDANVLWLDGLNDNWLRSVLVGSSTGTRQSGWLQALVEQDAASERWQTELLKTCGVLWEVLLGPMHECLRALGLAEGAPILLMPHGGLNVLPLHAAWREVGQEYRTFLDDFTVSYAPSGYIANTARQQLRDSARQGRSSLTVADPIGDLPFAGLEGRAVTAIFSKYKNLLLAGDAASLNAVSRHCRGRGYIHFACHSRYSWRDPARSSISLAAGAELSLHDLSTHLHLDACRLVTLSGCETGLIEAREGSDEPFGLPAGFLQVGSPAVVSTLWQVDDLSTMLLMERFYNAHLQDGLAPAAALRAAQLWLRDSTAEEMRLSERWYEVYKTTTNRKLAARAIKAANACKLHPDTRPFRHPYYWAPFTLSGA
jgi:CHAT domain-containing protein/tetratricopeptide (TPR) repeat protein